MKRIKFISFSGCLLVFLAFCSANAQLGLPLDDVYISRIEGIQAKKTPHLELVAVFVNENAQFDSLSINGPELGVFMNEENRPPTGSLKSVGLSPEDEVKKVFQLGTVGINIAFKRAGSNPKSNTVTQKLVIDLPTGSLGPGVLRNLFNYMAYPGSHSVMTVRGTAKVGVKGKRGWFYSDVEVVLKCKPAPWDPRVEIIY
jgi:hypothetical protein